MMKRFISLALVCLLLVCFVGCDGGSEAKNYVFKYMDVEIAIGGDSDAVVSQLIDDRIVIETPSCGGGAEPDREYTYWGVKFNTVNENGVNKIVKIVLTDDSVSTPEGITIGDGPIDACFVAI
jgi:uncharacterized lipoprotein YehR (DUF1307 family)